MIGKNTIACMQSGAVYGNASCIDGMVDRIREELCKMTGAEQEQVKVNCNRRTGKGDRAILPQ